MTPEELRGRIESIKVNTIEVIGRGKEPYINGAALVLLLDALLDRIEALESAKHPAEGDRVTPSPRGVGEPLQ